MARLKARSSGGSVAWPRRHADVAAVHAAVATLVCRVRGHDWLGVRRWGPTGDPAHADDAGWTRRCMRCGRSRRLDARPAARPGP